MIISENEKSFRVEIKNLLDEWLNYSDFEVNELYNEIDLLEFEKSLIVDFLGIDESEVDHLYNKINNSLLIDLFIDNFNKKSLIEFILFIIHFVIEKKTDLFFEKLECTGRYCGHWATISLKNSIISNTINKRIISLNNDNSYSEYYKNKYCDSLNKIPISHVKNENKKSLDIKFLVKLSGIALVGGIIFNCWKNVSGNKQAMFTIGCASGSIKLYGFCLEKTKQCPEINSKYEPSHLERLSKEIDLPTKRVEHFIQYFLEFNKTKDTNISTIAKSSPQTLWYHFQLFFWLITQPFSDSENLNNAWECFLCEGHDIKTINSCLVKIHRLNDDYLNMTLTSCNIIRRIDNAIHPANIPIFEDIVKNCNERS